MMTRNPPEPVQIQYGLEAVPITPGLEQVPAEHHPQADGPQVVLGKEEKEVLTEHDPSESRPSVCGGCRENGSGYRWPQLW